MHESLSTLWDVSGILLFTLDSDRKGRFIETFAEVRAFLTSGASTPDLNGIVEGLDPDGTAIVRVVAAPNSPEAVGRRVRVPFEKLENVPLKARIGPDNRPHWFNKPAPKPYVQRLVESARAQVKPQNRAALQPYFDRVLSAEEADAQFLAVRDLIDQLDKNGEPDARDRVWEVLDEIRGDEAKANLRKVQEAPDRPVGEETVETPDAQPGAPERGIEPEPEPEPVAEIPEAPGDVGEQSFDEPNFMTDDELNAAIEAAFRDYIDNKIDLDELTRRVTPLNAERERRGAELTPESETPRPAPASEERLLPEDAFPESEAPLRPARISEERLLPEDALPAPEPTPTPEPEPAQPSRLPESMRPEEIAPPLGREEEYLRGVSRQVKRGEGDPRLASRMVSQDGRRFQAGDVVDVPAGRKKVGDVVRDRPFMGVVQRINPAETKVLVRDYNERWRNVNNNEGRENPYVDFWVKPEELEFADVDGGRAANLQMMHAAVGRHERRQYAGKGAGRVAPALGRNYKLPDGWVGDVPAKDERFYPDANGRLIGNGDVVELPDGTVGYVIRPELPWDRDWDPRILVRPHGGGQPIHIKARRAKFLRDPYGDAFLRGVDNEEVYAPTPDEAASLGRKYGFSDEAVAALQAGDASAFRAALADDTAWIDFLDDAAEKRAEFFKLVADGRGDAPGANKFQKHWHDAMALQAAYAGGFADPDAAAAMRDRPAPVWDLRGSEAVRADGPSFPSTPDSPPLPDSPSAPESGGPATPEAPEVPEVPEVPEAPAQPSQNAHNPDLQNAIGQRNALLRNAAVQIRDAAKKARNQRQADNFDKVFQHLDAAFKVGFNDPEKYINELVAARDAAGLAGNMKTRRAIEQLREDFMAYMDDFNAGRFNPEAPEAPAAPEASAPEAPAVPEAPEVPEAQTPAEPGPLMSDFYVETGDLNDIDVADTLLLGDPALPDRQRPGLIRDTARDNRDESEWLIKDSDGNVLVRFAGTDEDVASDVNSWMDSNLERAPEAPAEPAAPSEPEVFTKAQPLNAVMQEMAVGDRLAVGGAVEGRVLIRESDTDWYVEDGFTGDVVERFSGNTVDVANMVSDWLDETQPGNDYLPDAVSSAREVPGTVSNTPPEARYLTEVKEIYGLLNRQPPRAPGDVAVTPKQAKFVKDLLDKHIKELPGFGDNDEEFFVDDLIRRIDRGEITKKEASSIISLLITIRDGELARKDAEGRVGPANPEPPKAAPPLPAAGRQAVQLDFAEDGAMLTEQAEKNFRKINPKIEQLRQRVDALAAALPEDGDRRVRRMVMNLRYALRDAERKAGVAKEKALKHGQDAAVEAVMAGWDDGIEIAHVLNGWKRKINDPILPDWTPEQQTAYDGFINEVRRINNTGLENIPDAVRAEVWKFKRSLKRLVGAGHPNTDRFMSAYRTMLREYDVIKAKDANYASAELDELFRNLRQISPAWEQRQRPVRPEASPNDKFDAVVQELSGLGYRDIFNGRPPQGWTQLTGSGGMNPSGIFEDQYGDKYFLKVDVPGRDAEIDVGNLYRALGFKQPRVRQVNPDSVDHDKRGLLIFELAGAEDKLTDTGNFWEKFGHYNPVGVDDLNLADPDQIIQFMISNAVIMNSDRHGGNVMIGTNADGEREIIPIDNGMALRNTVHGALDFDDPDVDPPSFERYLLGSYGGGLHGNTHALHYQGTFQDYVRKFGRQRAADVMVEWAQRMRETFALKEQEFVSDNVARIIRERIDWIADPQNAQRLVAKLMR